MSENNNIVVYEQPAGIVRHRTITEDTVKLIGLLATSFHRSNYFGVANEAQAVVVMIKAYELGFPITSAFDLIHVINTSGGTQVTLSPKGAIALVMNSGLIAEYNVADSKNGCTVRMKRKDNGIEYTTSFTIDDARKAGLIKEKGAWEKYPANMCRWRAIGFCIDVLFSDVQYGLKRADQFGGVPNEAGDIIDWEPPDNSAPAPKLIHDGTNSPGEPF